MSSRGTVGDAGGLDRDNPSVKPFTGWLMNLSTEPFTPLLPEDWGDYWADLNDCVAPGKHLPAQGQAQPYSLRAAITMRR